MKNFLLILCLLIGTVAGYNIGTTVENHRMSQDKYNSKPTEKPDSPWYFVVHTYEKGVWSTYLNNVIIDRHKTKTWYMTMWVHGKDAINVTPCPNALTEEQRTYMYNNGSSDYSECLSGKGVRHENI